MRRAKFVPFGLLFEEIAPDVVEEATPVYDESTGLSFVRDPTGELMPYVDAYGPQTTQTVTKRIPETNDNDSPRSCSRGAVAATKTVTFILNESADSDRIPFPAGFAARSIQATRTVTANKRETSDPDRC